MVHARVSEECIHFLLMYTTDNIFPVLPIKHLVNQDCEPTTTQKLATSTKPSVSNLHVLFRPCVVSKTTAHVHTKFLNMRNQPQKGFCGILVGIPHHQKGYLIYVPSTRKIVSSHDAVSNKIFSSTLAYTSRPYSEALDMRPVVSYISYATSSREQTVNIIIFAHFEEANLKGKRT